MRPGCTGTPLQPTQALQSPVSPFLSQVIYIFLKGNGNEHHSARTIDEGDVKVHRWSGGLFRCGGIGLPRETDVNCSAGLKTSAVCWPVRRTSLQCSGCSQLKQGRGRRKACISTAGIHYFLVFFFFLSSSKSLSLSAALHSNAGCTVSANACSASVTSLNYYCFGNRFEPRKMKFQGFFAVDRVVVEGLCSCSLPVSTGEDIVDDWQLLYVQKWTLFPVFDEQLKSIYVCTSNWVIGHGFIMGKNVNYNVL